MKRCSSCGVGREPEDFHKDPSKRSGLSSSCRDCRNAKSVWVDIKRRYGIGRAQFEALAEAQDGLCAICKRGPQVRGRLTVDHSHKTGKVRALLCQHCNLALGHFGECIGRLIRAIAYLEKHNERESEGERAGEEDHVAA